jgi:A/G-specific adenine glycosylase
MPRESVRLRKLPGIGRYTAAAIASIAFGEAVAVVDGNVERVLSRLTGKQTKPLDHWLAAQGLIDADRPGDFNQALMELGATVCLPKNPVCGLCPISQWCGTRGEHAVLKPSARKRATAGYILAGSGEKIALVQRPKTARLMAGMWELPSATRLQCSAPLLTVRHSITTTDYAVKVWRGKPPKGSVQLNVAQAAKLPLTGLTRKILRNLSLLRDQEA